MWAMTTSVDIAEDADPREGLRTVTIPRVKAAPGFQRGIWIQHEGGRRGMGVVVFDSEDNARAAKKMLESFGESPFPGVTIRTIEIYDVVGEA